MTANCTSSEGNKTYFRGGEERSYNYFHISIHILIFFTSMWLKFETIIANKKFPKEIILAGKVWLTKLVYKGSTDAKRNKMRLFTTWCWRQAHPSLWHLSILDCCSWSPPSPPPHHLAASLTLSLSQHRPGSSLNYCHSFTMQTSLTPIKRFDLLVSSMDLMPEEISLRKIFCSIYEMVMLSRNYQVPRCLLSQSN